MIHKYKLGGFNIVLDVNSGGVHIVDELTYDMLDNVEPPFEDSCPQKVMDKLLRFYPRDEIENVKNSMDALLDKLVELDD